MVTPAAKREAVVYVRAAFEVSGRRVEWHYTSPGKPQ